MATRKQIHKMYNKYSKAHELKIQRKLASFFIKQINNISKEIKKRYNANNKLKKDNNKISKADAEKEAEKVLKRVYSLDKENKELYNLIYSLLIGSGETAQELTNLRLFGVDDDYLDFAVIEKDYIKHLETHGAKLVTRVNNTTRNNIKDILVDGTINGESYITMADTMVKKTNISSKSRAKMIAETEVHTSFLVNRDLNSKVAGFKQKRWLDSDDASVRDSHAKFDNLGYVDIEHMYGGVIKFPGQPGAPAKEIIRCRCEIVYK